ncbi:hypothetical protein [Lentilactobacillus parakefiri]|uniref:Uncharacterized protein n=1 Tax=Lentilactobacillus parakefiri TaxID=152332 RepID=A0A224V6Y7_9LACO|nr:hypothetical protein [Lentilactobacillus parakefiri]TDG91832.1 hypothetical protein C5L28_001237 [Lentilactobacillus parakefiri]GAW72816.1 hypothetical protein LPKJCM_01946 [Lentilactobacillus parakefiri]
MNDSKEHLDFFNQAYSDPSKHSGCSTNSNLRFESRADALQVKNMLIEKSPHTKFYDFSVEYINPNKSMQVGWYITVKKVDKPAQPHQKDQTKENNQQTKK